MPFIVRWPARVQSGTSDALVTQTDFMASFAKMLDQKLPNGAAADSQNTLAAILGEDPEGATYIVEEARNWALRKNDWKLVRNDPPKKKQNAQPTYELYNLAEDIGEEHNVAGKHPETVEQMSGMLEEIIAGASARKVFRQAEKN